MAALPKRFYWDACTWIALIQEEKAELADGGIEDRGVMCRSVINSAVKNKCELFTSALGLAEVCKAPKNWTEAAEQRLLAFFENDYIVVVSIDRQIGELARKLILQGHSKLRPADASHVVAAAVANVDEMHTFDEKLLSLDGKVSKADGTKLRICKPGEGGKPLPLMEAADGV